MELRRTETGFALYKEKEVIGHCTLHPAAQGAALAALAIDPAWRRKGYGSYLLKEVLRSFGGYDREAATVFTAPLPADCAEMAFWAKFYPESVYVTSGTSQEYLIPSPFPALSSLFLSALRNPRSVRTHHLSGSFAAHRRSEIPDHLH